MRSILSLVCVALASTLGWALAAGAAQGATAGVAAADRATAAEAVGDAAAGRPAHDVVVLEQATGELARAKRAGAARVDRLARDGAARLKPCWRRGPGWKRIRAVTHASQRARYAAAARTLLADMRTLLTVQQPLIAVHGDAYGRFVARLRGAELHDPLLGEAVAAQARRVEAYRDVARVKANCAVFNRALRVVRDFPTRTPQEIVRADYRVSPRARRIERHVSNQVKRIDRRSGIGHRDADTLADAAQRMVALGGSAGYATAFQYALSLR